MKKYLYIIFSVFVVLLLVFGFAMKKNLNEFISGKMQEQNSGEASLPVQEFIQKNYNYAKSSENFEFTFLEFSSTGCTSCEQMEPVLEEIRNIRNPKIKVVFVHIMKPENLDLMKYYGVSAVPMQILLDKEGNEFYRHFGIISAEDLLVKFVSK